MALARHDKSCQVAPGQSPSGGTQWPRDLAAVNPLARRSSARLPAAVLLRGTGRGPMADSAAQSRRLQKSYRLNHPERATRSTMLLTVDPIGSASRRSRCSRARRAGRLSGSISARAGHGLQPLVAIWRNPVESKRSRSLPASPSLESQEKRDRVPCRHVSKAAWSSPALCGSLDGLRVQPPGALVDVPSRAAWGRPASVIFCDRFRLAELVEAIA